MTMCIAFHGKSIRPSSTTLVWRMRCTRNAIALGNGTESRWSFAAVNCPRTCPREIALCLYRIAQEAFWNAAKYAHSDRVTVELNADPEFVHLSIRDFGSGFDPLQVSENQGLGLASMKERARLVRGTIYIDSAPGAGVKIAVQVPLPEDDRMNLPRSIVGR